MALGSKNDLIDLLHSQANKHGLRVLFFPNTPKTVRAIPYGGNPDQRREWPKQFINNLTGAIYKGDGWFELIDDEPIALIEPESKPVEQSVKKTRIAKTKKKKDE